MWQIDGVKVSVLTCGDLTETPNEILLKKSVKLDGIVIMLVTQRSDT